MIKGTPKEKYPLVRAVATSRGEYYVQVKESYPEPWEEVLSGMRTLEEAEQAAWEEAFERGGTVWEEGSGS